MLKMHQKIKLRDLKKKYGFEMATLNRGGLVSHHGNDELELLKTLLLLDIDRTIANSINSAQGLIDDDEMVKIIVAVLSNSYGQLCSLYAKKYGDAAVLEQIFEKSKNEAGK